MSVRSSATWAPSDRTGLSTSTLLVPTNQDRQVSPSSFRGRLQSLRRSTSPARPKASQSPEGVKGALGLTLLHEPSEPRVDFIFQSTLTMHDYGQALLADLYNSPNLKKNGNAYLLARRDPIYADIASRIHSLYFLGTPHRGADSSAFVTTLISMSIGSGSKAFVKELIPGSGTLQANHRRLVKFDSVDDPNYNILLRCFNTTIEEIERSYKFESHRTQMKQIAQAFDVAERPDGDFIRMLDKLHMGSCEWLTSHEAFHDWLECDLMDNNAPIKAITSGPAKATPRFLWLNGPPGSGKSVASGHVIKYLESFNLDCAYFFFKNNEKPSLTQFLLSMALQMAESNFQVRHTFLAMMEEGETIDSHSDHIMVWNNIFLGRIFKMALSQPQYWVIDALDECQARLLTTLMSMFSRIEPNVPLRIFITSRPNGHVERLLNQEKIARVEMHTGQAESLRDIDGFVRSRLSPTIIADFNEEEGDLVAEIIEKSNGIFLWASLIMTRLDEAHSIEAMRKTLDQVPSEMSGMYSGILQTIIESPNADLAHCVLKWVVCARKPLTTEELREVVRLDINQTLRTADRFSQICGNLITVDNNYVQVMHQTVKEFLTGEQSDYYIPRSWSHARIAELCLQHLNGRNFNPPRTRRAPAVSSKTDPNSSAAVFDDYAASNFSYHLAHCSPSESTLQLLPLLGTFVSSNVLTWIERTAKTGRLSLLTRTVQNLKSYLSRQVATSSPLDSDYQLTSRFVDDLVRLSAIYGPNLVNTPSSIYSLIPLLCPKSSIIHWKFARQFKQKVLCSFNNDWDERLSSFTFSSRVMSIACADQFFGLGLADGAIKIYRQSTFELLNTIHHGEPVRRLANGNITGVLVSGGLKTIKVWGPRQALLWSTVVPEQPLSFRFSSDDSKLYVPLRNGEVYVYRAKNGARLDALVIVEEEVSDSDSDAGMERQQQQKRTVPVLVRISPMLGIAAIAYRSSHLKLSYYESDERVETFEKEGYEDGGLPPQVLDVAFNENAEQNLMAVAYQDGDLVTLDPWTLEQKHAYHLNAHTLAASPDGHTLAAGDSNTCNVWEPSVLIKKNLADDSSSEEADDYLMPASNLVCTRSFEGSKAITIMTQAGDSNFIFCGREEGSITVHDTNTGKVLTEFQFHARMVDIRHLEWNAKSKVLFSVDASRRCIATRSSSSSSRSSNTFSTSALQTQSYRHSSAPTPPPSSSQPHPAKKSTSRASQTAPYIQPTRSEQHAGSRTQPTPPASSSSSTTAKPYTSSTGKTSPAKHPTTASPSTYPPNSPPRPSPSPTNGTPRPGLSTLIQTTTLPASPLTAFLTLDLSTLDPATTTRLQITCTARQLAANIKSVLGIHRSNLFFMSGRGWVCSVSLKNLPASKAYARHFFIPSVWQTGGEPIARVVSKTTVAMAYRDEVVVLQGFLEFEHKTGAKSWHMTYLSIEDSNNTKTSSFAIARKKLLFK
ncbi:hypothetical protein CHGG_10469 [Chaetomium globosum CBS 148.51]|uniref:NACHT domain-containing protein n=1 Tax=Chaetomium globosum (strain ATCC 6205 / CBS 148.51 / DSM 1962 / NBRC 6347 / NRRL 1970) TaxID=306901 RepID=Q2GNI5_CHAGB|nr:uncharacterized protein CHGG_10469 [Chaetomium globosum CBS 148.51]EAQ84065.1 hypothetical protein CHGG_10469 [Chaetomium globosum CBS 148.51]